MFKSKKTLLKRRFHMVGILQKLLKKQQQQIQHSLFEKQNKKNVAFAKKLVTFLWKSSPITWWVFCRLHGGYFAKILFKRLDIKAFLKKEYK